MARWIHWNVPSGSSYGTIAWCGDPHVTLDTALVFGAPVGKFRSST